MSTSHVWHLISQPFAAVSFGSAELCIPTVRELWGQGGPFFKIPAVQAERDGLDQFHRLSTQKPVRPTAGAER